MLRLAGVFVVLPMTLLAHKFAHPFQVDNHKISSNSWLNDRLLKHFNILIK